MSGQSKKIQFDDIVAEITNTSRLRIHHLQCGRNGAPPMLMIHGHMASSVFWKPLMNFLAPYYDMIAPDLNGFGNTPFKPVVAETGIQDWSDDLISLMDAHGIEKAVIITHDTGGLVGWDMLGRYSERLEKLIQIAPLSPFGLGGTKDEPGTPVYPDFSGSGAGIANAQLVNRLATKDSGRGNPESSPIHFLRNTLMGHQNSSEFEKDLLSGMFEIRIGPNGYPGDVNPTENWPDFSPGTYGILNAVSPKNLIGISENIIQSASKPIVYWVRGDSDKLISDASIYDPAIMGLEGKLPGWPGKDVYPPQPMLEQIRYLLKNYAASGGGFEEHLIPQCGHSPHIEKPDIVLGIMISA